MEGCVVRTTAEVCLGCAAAVNRPVCPLSPTLPLHASASSSPSLLPLPPPRRPPPPAPPTPAPAPALRSLIDGVAASFVATAARTGHTELSIEAANGPRAPSGASAPRSSPRARRRRSGGRRTPST